MTIRHIVLIAAAAAVLLPSNYTLAQAPQPASDAERLKALEAKMDKVLKLLEGKAPQPVTKEQLDRSVELFSAAKETLAAKFEADQQAYLDWRIKSPFGGVGRNAPMVNFNMQRTAKDGALLQDLQQRQAEVVTRTALVKNVGDDEGRAAALLVLLQRRGVDVELLRRTVPHGRDQGVTAVEVVRLYGESLKLEGDELGRQVEAAQNRAERLSKDMREYNAYEVTEERLRTNRDNSQKLLDVIVQRLAQFDAIRNSAPKP
jgi:hypothetical protein